MTERGPSRTAHGAASLRAFHQLVDGEPKILDDPLAASLLDLGVVGAIRAAAGAPQTPAGRALRTQVVLRSRFAEDRMALASRRGVRQCVILGAGLDTFAYRQPDWAKDWRIFEVDHPASQADKRRRLDAAGIEAPANLAYVAIDFERVSLREGLAAGGVDVSAPAFFSCLGVLVYLARDAAEAVFALVASFPAGSEIAFTFFAPPASPSPVAARAAQAGEPWRTQFEPVALARDLRGMGFSEVSILEPAEAAERYFPITRADGLAAPRRSSIGAAIVG